MQQTSGILSPEAIKDRTNRAKSGTFNNWNVSSEVNVVIPTTSTPTNFNEVFSLSAPSFPNSDNVENDNDKNLLSQSAPSGLPM